MKNYDAADETSITNYIELVKQNNYKYIDLNQSKESVQRQIIELIEKGEISNADDMKKVIHKSYFRHNQKDFSASEIDSLLGTFFNNYIFENKTDKTYTDKEYLINLVDFYLNQIEEMTGDYLYCPIAGTKIFRNNPLIKKIVTKMLKDRRFENMSHQGFRHFFIRKSGNGNAPIEVREKDQKYLLNTYKQIVDDLVAAGKVEVEDEVMKNLLYNCILFTNNIIERLTEESKKSEIFIETSKRLEEFTQCYRPRKNDMTLYYDKMVDCLRNVRLNTQTKEDEETIGDFLNRAGKVVEGLKAIDEQGHIHPTNYFVDMPMLPRQSVLVARKLSKCVQLSKEQTQTIGNFCSLVSRTFDTDFTMRGTGVTATPNAQNVLSGYQGKWMNGDFSLDISNRSDFMNFCRQVEDYVKENNLFPCEECLRSVADAMVRGREPIYNPPKTNKNATELEK